MTDSQTIVVSDIKQCLNCGNCIDACKRRHKDVSRFARERSAIIGSNLIPNLCKICMNPKCIEACRRHGIERDNEGHIVITDNCIGCGLCMRACPYGAIHFSSKQELELSFIASIFSSLWQQKASEAEKNNEDDSSGKKRQPRVAVKCDGCAGYSNRACVNNCPAGALKVMTIKGFISKNKRSIGIQLRELLKYSFEGERPQAKEETAEDGVPCQDTRLDKKLIFRILWVSLVVITAGCLYIIYRPYMFIPDKISDLNMAAYSSLKPSGMIGHALGIAGTVFMFLSYTLYVLRKKVKSFESLGPLSFWLEIHVFLGILGCILIMFHSTFTIRESVTFWIMILVVISGIFGKVLFSYCFCGISTIYQYSHEIDRLIEKDLRNVSYSSPVIKRVMDLKSPGFPSTAGLMVTFRRWKFVKKETSCLVDLVNEEYDNDQQGEVCKWADQLIKRLGEIHSTAILNLCLSLLSKWRLVHKFSSYVLFIVVLAHVLVTAYWGYKWIL
jgi:Fe-S-cluster-containing hydrogenase component 2